MASALWQRRSVTVQRFNWVWCRKCLSSGSDLFPGGRDLRHGLGRTAALPCSAANPFGLPRPRPAQRAAEILPARNYARGAVARARRRCDACSRFVALGAGHVASADGCQAEMGSDGHRATDTLGDAVVLDLDRTRRCTREGAGLVITQPGCPHSRFGDHDRNAATGVSCRTQPSQRARPSCLASSSGSCRLPVA